MSFASKAQQRFLYATDPELAKKMGKGTNYKNIPDKVEECGCGPDPIAMERLPGGEGEPHDPGDFDQEQLMKGIHTELEHTNDVTAAMEIAMDHLAEDPIYYDNLEKVHSDEPEVQGPQQQFEDIYCQTDPRHDPKDVWNGPEESLPRDVDRLPNMPKLEDVFNCGVDPRIDPQLPFDPNPNQVMKHNIRFSQSGMRSGRR